jgi:hypothetical protein
MESYETECPWCGAALSLAIDCTGGSQQYVEDCAVCCQPILVTVRIIGVGPEPFTVQCERDD